MLSLKKLLLIIIEAKLPILLDAIVFNLRCNSVKWFILGLDFTVEITGTKEKESPDKLCNCVLDFFSSLIFPRILLVYGQLHKVHSDIKI